ncbi:MAG: histidine triad nucleotide-binding protein [Myxococcales bacterium]|nr:MAG: histidine triad nucleotide-binding protein [Myxococcales bacterium]
MADCIFCKIVAGEIPAQVVYRDEQAMAFKDIRPLMTHHYLLIPTRHIATVNDADDANQAELGRLFVAAGKVAREQGFADQGYRLVCNTNRDAGQEVFHIHLHMFAGKGMGWPPF